MNLLWNQPIDAAAFGTAGVENAAARDCGTLTAAKPGHSRGKGVHHQHR